jgi:hypothetical protein
MQAQGICFCIWQDFDHARPSSFQVQRKVRWPGKRDDPDPSGGMDSTMHRGGSPFFAISLIAGILYKRLGLRNDIIALYTSWLLLWSLKLIWTARNVQDQKFS